MNHTLGIMQSVGLGPEMDVTTFEQVRNFNNGWVHEFLPEHAYMKAQAEKYGPLGNIYYVEVLPRNVGNLLVGANKPYGDPIYFSVNIFPVCLDPYVRGQLLNTLDKLVKARNLSYTIRAVINL